MLVFLIVSFLSLASAFLVTKSISLSVGIFHWMRRIEYFSAFFVGFTALQSLHDLKFYVKCLFIVVFMVFIYGLGQKYLYWPIVTTQNSEYAKGVALRYTPGAHINSTFAGHYDLASFLVLILPLFFTFLFLVESKYKKILIMIVIASGYWLLMNAISRISIISFIIGVSIALFSIKKYKAIPLVILVTLIISAFSTNLVSRYSNIFEVTIKKLYLNVKPSNIYAIENTLELPKRHTNNEQKQTSSSPVFEDRSTSIRLNVEWPRALRAFYKNPLFGTGFSSITLATDNEYLRLLGEVGLVGFFGFSLLILRIFKMLIKNLPLAEVNFKNAFLAGIIGSFTAVFVNAIFIDIFEASKFAIIFWLMVGLSMSLLNIKTNE